MDSPTESIRFLVRLARGLHAYGTPAHRIEEAMEVATARLGVPSQFFSLPTVILAAFGAPENRSTGLVRVQPGSVHLEKLSLLDEVMRDLLDGRATPAEGAARVDEIESRPDRYPPLAQVAAFAVVSACGALFFGGSARDVVAAALLGAVAAAIGFLCRLHGGFRRVNDPLTAFVVSFLACVAASRIGAMSSLVATLSSLIVLLPGLALTMAIHELAEQSLVSGAVRLVTATVSLFELAAGVALGRALASYVLGGLVERSSPSLPVWTELFALVCAPFAYAVLFQARPRDTLPILCAGLLGYAGARLGARIVSPHVDLDFGGFVGAFAVGAASNLWARWRDRPVAVTLLPGILLLVPGSLGFRGVMQLLEHNVDLGVQTGFRMMLVAGSIVAGLLFSNIAVRARRVTLLLLVALTCACSREEPAHYRPGAAASGAGGAPKPPRVLLVTLDTLRADHVGAYGCDRPLTPNLDGLALAGTRFARAAAPAPETAPSHATMLCGRSPLSHGLVNHYVSLSKEVVTLPELVGHAGVATAALFHIFPFGEMGVTQGFDVRFRDISEEAKEIVPRFFAWLDELPAEKPAFAWVHLYLAHTPLRPPLELKRRFVHHPYAEQLNSSNDMLQRLHAHPDEIPRDYEKAFGQIYDAKVAFDDQRLGELLDGLRKRGALESTLVIVVADHGESLEYGMFGMHALDAHQTTMHVPLVIAGPKVKAEQTIDAVVPMLDLFPTMLELFGVAPPAGIEGTSLWPFLNGAAAKEEGFAWGSVPLEPEEYVADALPKILTLWSGRYKLVVEDAQTGGRELLFDLDADSQEEHDVAADHQDVVRALRHRLDESVEKARAAKTAAGELTEQGREEMKRLGYIKK